MLTRLGMFAEQILRAFWPLMSLVFVIVAALMLGAQDFLSLEAFWGIIVGTVLAVSYSLYWGGRRLRWPSRDAALARLDASLGGRPIQAILDQPAPLGDDPGTQALWQAHQKRMAEKAAGARPVAPDLRIAARDPYALRYVAVLGLMLAALFGSVSQLATVVPQGGNTVIATGPSWEGWAEPPSYTGLPTLYLNDIASAELELPQGTRMTLRLYGVPGALSVAETISGREQDVSAASESEHDFVVSKSGRLEIQGDAGQAWTILIRPDLPPELTITSDAEIGEDGQMTLPYKAYDDYGVTSGRVRIALDLATLKRDHGLARAPDSMDDIVMDLPLPISGGRQNFSETIIEDFSKHVWANLPVTIHLQAQDAAENQAHTPARQMDLPARRFFDPLAAAIIEQRRDLLWARANARRVAQVLRTLTHRPDDIFQSETAYLRLRVLLRRLERFTEYGLKPEQQAEIAEALWQIAIKLEEGDIGDALQRMQQAQERLSEAMRNGASDQEIAELMQELREATQDYLRQLSRQAGQQDQQENGGSNNQESMQMTSDDLQKMMDRIQELMEQGRMAEAEQALREFQEMMENMRVTQGEGQPSPGEQAMEGLADTLRDQQGLSDQAFRDLQEQFNPGAQAGQNQGNEGRSGGLGRGQSHEGEGGQGQGQGEEPGQGAPAQQSEQGPTQGLAERQRALRQELQRQQQGLPGSGSEAGDAARDALGRAGRAMEGAEEALRNDDLAEAIDQQAEAMEALREGMRSLGEAMAENQRNGQEGQGQAQGPAGGQRQDPLGRNAGADGAAGSEGDLLQGKDVYRRARDLLDEIRRRSGDSQRPVLERDYLKRLLDRF